jgi:uncharacterized protein YndB with AHSA1/START domain
MRSPAIAGCAMLTLSMAAVHDSHAEGYDMDSIIHASVSLQCDVGHAFELFTNSRLLESWLTEVAEVEPVEGGKYELFWQPADRQNDSTIGCRITAFEHDTFLSFEWKSAKQYKHFANAADPLTHVVVFFIPRGECTQVHVVHSGWRSSQEWEEARKWQERAWAISLDRLRQTVNGR